MSKPTGSTAPAFQAMEKRLAELQVRYSRVTLVPANTRQRFSV
jgi:hypothetical protein